MWGGGGGLVEYRAALLASHGFAAFALEYLFPKEVKKVDDNYFEVTQPKAPYDFMVCTNIHSSLKGAQEALLSCLGWVKYVHLFQSSCSC